MDHPVPEKREPGWYLSLMAPNVRGQGYCWLDPSRLYANSEAMQDCIADLVAPFDIDDVDLVAGIDAMGFVLGAAIANHLKKGFLAVRKSGHLCVKTDSVPYVDYSTTEKMLEIRKDPRPFPKGTRVLIVDQWVETGGTMSGAIQLVERNEGVVAGIAVIAFENGKTSERSMEIQRKYKCVSCVPVELQPQIDQQYLESFKYFEGHQDGN